MVQIKNFNPPRVNAPHVVFEDRGDPAAFDYQVGDLTLDGTWYDLDLSIAPASIPVGAKAVLIQVLIRADAANRNFEFRANGQTNIINACSFYTQVANQALAGQAIVALDANRTIEYIGANAAWTSIYLTVAGWWI